MTGAGQRAQCAGSVLAATAGRGPGGGEEAAMVAVCAGVFRAGWRARRRWLTGAVAALALLVGGLAVLAWPAQRSGSGGSAVDGGARRGRGAAETGGRGRPAGRRRRAPSRRSGRRPATPAGPSRSRCPARRSAPASGSWCAPPSSPWTSTSRPPATRQVRTTAIAAGGLVVEEQTGERGAWLVLRVPADTLDRVIDDIAAIGT